MHLGHEVPVAVERRLNRGMAELHLDVLRMGPLRDQEARVRVTQVMEPNPVELRAPQHARPVPAAEVVSVHDVAPQER